MPGDQVLLVLVLSLLIAPCWRCPLCQAEWFSVDQSASGMNLMRRDQLGLIINRLPCACNSGSPDPNGTSRYGGNTSC
ncbi:hypothetical protein F5Y03DRAFT_336349 [Xylaria venustula]|nr:hypothetical protein F5Y03DRAFT_336349 [Xylaria venustula]